MRNSAWYHKLWRNKLDELSLKKEDAAAWANMSNLLDEQLPISAAPSGNGIYKLSTYIKILLILFIAAIVSLPATLYMVKHNANLANRQKHSASHISNNEQTSNPRANQIQTQHLHNLNDNGFTDSQSTNLSENESQNHSKNRRTNTVVIDGESPDKGNSPHTLNGTDSKNSIKQQRVATMLSQNSLQLAGSSASRSKNSSNFNQPNHNYISAESLNSYHRQKSKHPLTDGQNASYAAHLTTKNRQGNSHINNYKMSKRADYSATEKELNNKGITPNNTATTSNKTAQSNNDKESADTKIDPVKGSTNNADTKEAKASGSRSRSFNTSPKTVKNKDSKSKANVKKSKANYTPPKFNYGLEAGMSAGNGNSLYAGILGSYQVKPRWLINIGLRLNTYRTISGGYSHQSYYSPDSIPAFKITDSRKVMALTIPVIMEYKLTKNISLKAGPVISMRIKQSGISSKLGTVPNIRDTIYHTQTIDSTLKRTTINKLNVGFTGGISIQIKHFNVDAMYQALTPYKVNSGLGSYRSTNQNLQIGIGYKFK